MSDSNNINPAEILIPSAANAQVIGPYKFRQGASMQGVVLTFLPTTTATLLTPFVAPPDVPKASVAASANLVAAAANQTTIVDLGTALSLKGTTLPSCDIYLVATVSGGDTLYVRMEGIPSKSRV